MNVTAILLNYKRDKNVHRIIPMLKQQTAQLKVVLINNGPPFVYEPASEDDTPHETWTLPRNVGPFARWLVAYAQTGWLYIQDDDVVPGDTNFVEDLITLAMERQKVITGLFCRNVHKQPPYYLHKDAPLDGPTSYVKAICMALHRTTLSKVRFPAGDVGRNEDIHIGLEIGRGEPVHYVSAALRGRIIQLDQMGVALSHEPNHYTERDAYCGWWLRKEGLT